MSDATRMGRRAFLKSTVAAATGPGIYSALATAAEQGGGGLLAPLPTHHEAKARNLVVIFLTGGFSHVDTFDYKPALARYHGKSVPSFGLRADETHDRPLLSSPFRFRACGESGLMISELFPNLGAMADELCVIRSLHTDIVEHFQAVLAMHTGSATVPMPSLGRPGSSFFRGWVRSTRICPPTSCSANTYRTRAARSGTVASCLRSTRG